LFDGLFGCTGCSSELYWCEWHNDPPRCCDPCDQCGNWIGAGYRAPYAHPYAVNGQVASPYYANQRTNQNGMSPRGIAQPIVRMQSPTPARSPYVAGRGVNPPGAAPAAKRYAANLTTRTPPQAQAPNTRQSSAGGTYRPMPW
jgi:hypothetical protein